MSTTLKKRTISFILVVVLLCALSTMAFAATKYVNVTDTPLLDNYNSSANILGYLHYNEPFVQVGGAFYNYAYGYAPYGTAIYSYYGQAIEGYVYYLHLS